MLLDLDPHFRYGMDPDPDSRQQNECGSKWIRIQIQNTTVPISFFLSSESAFYYWYKAPGAVLLLSKYRVPIEKDDT
jgi:hypothetical protein